MDIQEIQERFEGLMLANPDFDESLLVKDDEGCYEDFNTNAMYQMFEAGLEVGEKLQAAKAVQEWNSVDDKEPPLGTMVLICWSDALDVEPEKDYMDHDVDHGVNYWVNYNDGDEPSHWMLLPEPVAQEQN